MTADKHCLGRDVRAEPFACKRNFQQQEQSENNAGSISSTL